VANVITYARGQFYKINYRKGHSHGHSASLFTTL
jgi:hypothetical protein